jgi:Txe/YoeB family toxin of Txe-Axe toxin-antitoxin module
LTTSLKATFDKIIIIQSLKGYKTGNKLQDDLSTLTVFTDGVVSSELIDVDNKKEFLSLLFNIREDVLNEKYMPIIHVEAHGNADNNGLILASEESITWEEMKIPLAEINAVTHLNLVVCISACYGGSLASMLRTNDRAPCFFLVGPKKEMYPDDLLKDFTGFYEEILKTQSGSRAIKRLNKNLPGNDAKYFFTTAERFFELIWIQYLRVYCSKENLDKRANKILNKLKETPHKYLPSINDLKNLLVKIHSKKFDESKEIFFMMDLFQDNRDRFLVDYKKILKEANESSRGVPMKTT